MKQFTSFLLFFLLSAVACAAGAQKASAGRDYAFGMDDGCDSMRVRIAFHSPASGLMEIYPESTNDVIRVKMWPVGQRDDHVWGISQGKAKGKVDTNLRVGDVIGIRTGAPPPAAPKEKAYDAMDYVGEKDL